MTKEKTLRILSGDRFHNRGWESEMDSRVSDIMRGMRNATRKDIEEIKQEPRKYSYRSPIPRFKDVEIHTAIQPHEIEKTAREGNFDWIISCLDYGIEYGRTKGIVLLNDLKNVHAVKAILTNHYISEEVIRSETRGLDYFITNTMDRDAGIYLSAKENLGRIIIEHYIT